MKTAEFWINHLQMDKHPEEGYFKETYKASEVVTLENGNQRSASTGIYFLLTSDNFSAFHKIKSDEMWHHYQGSAISIYIIHPNGELELLKIGNNIDKGEQLQGMVPAGCWFGSRVEEPNTYSLVGCTVSPGFEFEDFEMAKRDELILKFPQHKEIIMSLTR
ncbi:MAG: cupin domain-containing protein [Crocinitomicaceae bacterium]